MQVNAGALYGRVHDVWTICTIRRPDAWMYTDALIASPRICCGAAYSGPATRVAVIPWPRIEQFHDTQVEQRRDAIVVDQNVQRLEVNMHDPADAKDLPLRTTCGRIAAVR